MSDEPEQPDNPFKGTPWEQMFSQFGGDTPGAGGAAGAGGQMPDLNQIFAQVQQLMQPNPDGKAVNWVMAKDLARKQVAAGGDRSMRPADHQAVADVARLAEHWLADASALPRTGSDGSAATPALAPAAWSRAEWVENTMATWQRVIEPVAEHVAGALGASLPGEAQQLAGPMNAMIRQLGGSVFGAQVGQAIGELAAEVLTGTEICLPLTRAGQVVLLPDNIEAFSSGLTVPLDDVRLYLALREVARQRLFTSVPWLGDHLFGLVAGYASKIQVDTSRLTDAMQDPAALQDPEALNSAIGDGFFEPVTTPEQRAVLERLETSLALVEGWVDDVVAEVTSSRMPAAGQLAEMVQRRRASGGPAEQTFASLVGLELRPRRLRDAANLWAAVRDARGLEGRDALWEYADLLPTAAALDDPIGFARDLGSVDELDDADFDALLRGPDESGGQSEKPDQPHQQDDNDSGGDDDGPTGSHG